MANVSYGFNQSRPRTQVFLDASGLGTQNVNSEKPLVLIGSAHGGQPGVPIAVSSYAQAKRIFRSGDLLDAIEMAWNASTNVGGAGPIFAVRADGATQGTVTVGGLKFTSKLYGADANNVQVQLVDNALTSSKTLTVYYQPDAYTKVYDNLGNIFTIQFPGAAASGTVELDVDATSHLATTLTLSTGTSGSEVLEKSYTLGSGVFADLNVLVNDIANLGDWTVVINTLGGNKNLQTQYLDAIVKTGCKASAVTVKAIGADIANQTSVDPYITVDPVWGTPVANFAITNLAGATTTVPAATWSNLFSAVSGLGAYYVVPLTSQQSLHGELAQFLDDQAQQGNMMRGFVGGGLKETSAQLQARQAGIRDSRVGLVGNSGKRTMSDGRVLNFQGYLYASMIAGIASGLPVGEPITYKHTNITALDG